MMFLLKILSTMSDDFTKYQNGHARARRRLSLSAVPGRYRDFPKKIWIGSMIFLLVLYGKDGNLTDLDFYLAPIFIGLVSLFCSLTDASTRSEEIMLIIIVGSLCLLALELNYVADHPCTLCTFQIPEVVHKHIIPKPGDILDENHNKAKGIWSLLMANNENLVPQQCAVCLSFFTDTAEWFSDKGLLSRGFLLKYGLDKFAKSNGYFEGEKQEALNLLEDVDDHDYSQMTLRQMDEWYRAIQSKSVPKGATKHLIQALATGLSSNLGSELLANTTRDSFCYPASRFSGPTPSEFIASLKRPRFTGESNDNRPMNISLSALKGIMRGDKMQQLGPHVCFMVRLAGLIPENTYVLEDFGFNSGNIAPIANEATIKGVDASFLHPGVWIPQTDEDKDRDGSGGDVTEAFLTLFTRLPMKDWVPIFFSTKEEYVAFFRWNMEHKLQDEYYFPKWLARGQVGSDMECKEDIERLLNETVELMSNQFRYSSERLRLTDPTTDKTLSDRAFFGSGMRRMTQIKLPGDPGYGFFHPVTPDYYESEEHKEFFRNKVMPSSDEITRMGNAFYGEAVSLSSFRDRVVEVDYMIATHWEHRDMFEEQGAILYLDAETRRPMGIWISFQKQIVLPTDGRHWEYAKFHYRATELTVNALL
jgi:hypothetical protein